MRSWKPVRIFRGRNRTPATVFRSKCVERGKKNLSCCCYSLIFSIKPRIRGNLNTLSEDSPTKIQAGFFFFCPHVLFRKTPDCGILYHHHADQVLYCTNWRIFLIPHFLSPFPLATHPKSNCQTPATSIALPYVTESMVNVFRH